METSELLKRVRKIEIKTRGLSKNIFAGEYHSAFKGRGMTFSEVREYQYGDDIRNIDWNVTARHNRPYVKIFEEERELTVMLMIDVSASRNFGTISKLKKNQITEIAAVLAFSAIQNNDKIGVIFFSDKIEKFIPPKKGRTHILHIIRELIDFYPEDKQTDIEQALEYMTNSIKKRCTCFVISDFIDEHDFAHALAIANRKHDVVALRVYDPRENQLPPVGMMYLRDAETGEQMWVDTSDKKLREAYEKYAFVREKELDAIFKKLYEDSVLGRITTEQFQMLSGSYTEEQNRITAGIPQKESEIQRLRETVNGTDSFLDKAKRYTDITELTPELLRLFIEKIVVHEKEVKWSKHAPQTVEICYNGIGYVGSGQQDVEEALEAPEPQQTQDTEKPRQAS